MNKIIIFLFLIALFYSQTWGYDLDLSVNKEIETKYDSNKLNNDMQVKSTTPPKTTPVFDNSEVKVYKTEKQTSKTSITSTKIPDGTKFRVKSQTAVSGWSGVNSVLKFATTDTVYKNGVTIPSGTVFQGIISNSHAAQIAGNGGLIEIKITKMIFNGKTIPVEGKITKANSKKIFFNRIKGKNQYIAGVNKQVQNGIKFYKKAKDLSSKLSKNSIGTLFSPIPIITGATGTAIYTVISPITGLIQKGKNISLPANTEYEIKLTKDAYI